MPDVPIRRALSKTLRFEIFKRDGFKCQYCGRCPPEVLLEVDHLIAVVDGGDNDDENLITACSDCNRGKGARPLTAVPKSLTDRMHEIAEREQQLAAYREVLQLRADRIEDEAWQVLRELFPEEFDALGRGLIKVTYIVSAKRFVGRLPLPLLIDAAQAARAVVTHHQHRRFLYFCKVCWNQIKQLDE